MIYSMTGYASAVREFAYGALNLEESFTCHCGSAVCRGDIRPEDFDRLSDVWDAQVRDAFPDVTRVPQPLWDFVSPKRLVIAAARDPRRAPSILRHRLLATPQAPPRQVAVRT